MITVFHQLLIMIYDPIKIAYELRDIFVWSFSIGPFFSTEEMIRFFKRCFLLMFYKAQSGFRIACVFCRLLTRMMKKMNK